MKNKNYIELYLKLIVNKAIFFKIVLRNWKFEKIEYKILEKIFNLQFYEQIIFEHLFKVSRRFML